MEEGCVGGIVEFDNKTAPRVGVVQHPEDGAMFACHPLDWCGGYLLLREEGGELIEGDLSDGS